MSSKKTKSQFIKSPIKITISLLVSNRVDSIKKCLDSILPILKSVPSELIAVDTGSTDGSIDIVRDYTNKIVKFKWCNDFSAARNAGLMQAKGEWFMYIDDDEYFEDVSEIINFFKSGECENYGTATYIVRNYLNPNSPEYSEGMVGRLSRRSKELKFTGKIHEAFYPFYFPQKNFESYVHHSGYAFTSYKKFIEHSNRNIKPLLEEVENNPTLRNLMQLVMEYAAIRQYEKAEETCIKALNFPLKDIVPPHGEYLKASIVEIILQRGEFKRAIEKGNEILNTYKSEILTEANIYVYMSTAAMNLLELNKTYEYFKKYVDFMKFYDKNPDKVSGKRISSLSDILNDISRINITLKVIKFFYLYGKTDIVFELFKNIPINSENKNLSECLTILFKTSYEENNYTVIKEIFEKYSENIPDILKDICEKAKNTFKNENTELIKTLADIKSKDPYIYVQKILYEYKNKNYETVKNMIEDYFKNGYDICNHNYSIIYIALLSDINITNVIKNISVEDWTLCIKNIRQNLDEASLETLIIKTNNLILPDNPLKAYLLTIDIRIHLIKEYINKNKDFMSEFWILCDDIINCSHILYNDTMFNETDILNLPSIYRFGFYISSSERAYNEKRFEDYIALIRKALKSYPDMSIPLKKIIKDFESEIKFKNIKELSEFEILAIKIKNQTEMLISEGKKQEALSIISQLEKLMPNDKDVIRLKKIAKS